MSPAGGPVGCMQRNWSNLQGIFLPVLPKGLKQFPCTTEVGGRYSCFHSEETAVGKQGFAHAHAAVSWHASLWTLLLLSPACSFIGEPWLQTCSSFVMNQPNKYLSSYHVPCQGHDSFYFDIRALLCSLGFSSVNITGKLSNMAY